MKASRLLTLPPYLFEELQNRCRNARSEGRDVIDLSVGDPDLPPPASLLSNLEIALDSTHHHRYPPQRGTSELKSAIRDYLGRRAGVAPDPDQILVLIGSKEGLAHLPWAVCNPGDVALIPNPGYPVYHSAARFAGCDTVRLDLDPGRGFLPDFDAVPREILDESRLCFLNYPNNPTSAVATEQMLGEAVDLAHKHDIVMVNDAAYADVYFDDTAVPLLCTQKSALERPVIEFFSFSKTFCITGWRIAFAVGHRDIIEALAHLKANIDSGVFGAIQEAVAKTLDSDGDAYAASMRETFQARRDLVIDRLVRRGFQCFPTCATFYVWVNVPSPWKSMDYALEVLEKTNVLVTPGIGFGEGGEGYFRIALTRPLAELEEAVERLATV